MQELGRYLFLAGSVPLIVLGAAHTLAMPRTPFDRRGLSPEDSTLAHAMARTRLLRMKGTDVWRAWVAFNWSHALGAIVFGCFVLLAGRTRSIFEIEADMVVPVAVLVSVAYLILAIRFCFRGLIIGAALSVVFFVASAVLLVRGQ
jgi:hypothetical protein